MTEFFLKSDLYESLPYAILSLGSFVVLMVSLFMKKESRGFFSALALAITVGAFVSLFYIGRDPQALGGMVAHDQIGFSFAFILLLTLMIVIPILPYDTEGLNEMPSSITSLLLLSACGGVMMAFSNHLLVFFIGLELLSLPLYVLTGLGSKEGQSSEASFKYFLLGSISSAIFIYGASLMWAALGTLNIAEMGQIFTTNLADRSSTTLWLGMALVIVSLFFKMGVFPFHLWIPDVYQSAPASIVAWMSGATKSATVVIVLRMLQGLPVSVQHQWIMPLSLLAIGSMIWGSLGALFQTNVRRMLGYSTIAHIGYVLLAVIGTIGGSKEYAASIISFYFLVYAFASMISFTIISIEEQNGRLNLKDYAGISKQSPARAFCLALSLLSLAGLPPLGGFMGKFNIFYDALNKGHTVLVMVAITTSLISLGYYLNFLVMMYMQEGRELKQSKTTFASSIVIGMVAAALLILGLYPSPVFRILGL
jgi:NADH-quinone oxidoreductase subunit N